MKGWAKVIQTENYDFVVFFYKEDNAFSIRYIVDGDLFEADYEPAQSNNIDCQEIFNDDKRLEKICLQLIDECKIHYGQQASG